MDYATAVIDIRTALTRVAYRRVKSFRIIQGFFYNHGDVANKSSPTNLGPEDSGTNRRAAFSLEGFTEHYAAQLAREPQPFFYERY